MENFLKVREENEKLFDAANLAKELQMNLSSLHVYLQNCNFSCWWKGGR